MHEVLTLLLANLDHAYDRRGWHGTNLRGALRGVTAERALRRPANERHNIWELTAHAAYWKYAVRNKLRGGKRGSFPMKGSNWFGSPPRADEKAWRALIQLLESEHRLLRAAIASLPDADLSDAKKLRLLYGVAAHDTYHTGQIQLVKRLVGR
jgi:uncharacterized damage-inducible protein DinB